MQLWLFTDIGDRTRISVTNIFVTKMRHQKSIWKFVPAALSTVIESCMVWRVCLFPMYSRNFKIFFGLLFGTDVACLEFVIYISAPNRYWTSYQHTNISICLCHRLICHIFDNALPLDGFKIRVRRQHKCVTNLVAKNCYQDKGIEKP